MYSNSKHINYNLEGSTAPLAILFMMVSMFFTISYLKNSFNQSAMEKYRYAEKKALYSAEAGLNEVGIVALPALKGADTTLLPYPGVNYGADENGDPIGKYYDIKCYTDYYNNTTTIGFFAEASGEASYTSPNGNDIKIVRTVGTTMLPDNFAEFMYFTDKEKPVGPGNTGFVNFGPADELDGHIHTNGVMDFSQLGCPTFTGSVSLVDDNPEYDLDFECQGYCWEDFLDENEECIVSVGEIAIDFPPDDGIEYTRSSADRIFTADDLLFRAGKQDTLIMTEIHFADNGYYATQWWYNIPPVSGPPVEFDFKFDSLGSGTIAIADGYLQGFVSGGPESSPWDPFDPETNTYDFSFLLVSNLDTNGINIENEIESVFSAEDAPHNVVVQNEDQTKVLSFTASGVNNLGGNIQILLAENPQISYDGPNGVGFLDNESVKLINTSATQGLAEDVEWNAYNYFHDHMDLSDWDDDGETGDVGGICTPGQMQHFDFMYWTQGDIFDGPGSAVYQSDYVYKERTFYPVNSPHIIYVKGGQVLVRGIVDGQYTIVTDYWQDYRMHTDPSIIDRQWCNIWIIDDIIYEDHNDEFEVVQPEDGGSNNVLGLVAGGSVILANTRPNGGGTSSNSGHSYRHVRVHAAVLAAYGGFISHYWQNVTENYSDFLEVNCNCNGNPGDCMPDPMYNGVNIGMRADCRGQFRNPYVPEPSDSCQIQGSAGHQTSDNAGDFRGVVSLWGSVVQQKRGYMKRNTTGPYDTGDIGYDKDYNYDYNLRITEPPGYPARTDEEGQISLSVQSYGQIE